MPGTALRISDLVLGLFQVPNDFIHEHPLSVAHPYRSQWLPERSN